MNYKKFLTHLGEDYSVYHLRKIMKGEVGFNPKLTEKLSIAKRRFILDQYIPKIIEKLEKENAKDVIFWTNAPIFRLAYARCKQKNLATECLFDEAMNIINHINCDNGSKGVKTCFKEYYKHTKNKEYNNAFEF